MRHWVGDDQSANRSVLVSQNRQPEPFGRRARFVCRCADVGFDQFPSGRQVVKAVHPGDAQVGRIRSNGEHIQTEACQRLVAVLREKRKRRNGTDG